MNGDNYTRADGQIDVVERGLHICNGPAITPEGEWLFHTDSFKACIHRYRLDAKSRLSDETLWRQFDSRQGTPDGLGAAALQAQPLAGATFALRPGVNGLPALGFGRAGAGG